MCFIWFGIVKLKEIKGEYMPLKMLKNLLVPQDTIFFDLMENQAETAYNASQVLSDLLKEHDLKKSEKIKDLEHHGDDLLRKMYHALNKTFIVPIDHSDISTLASALDDVIDLIDHAAILLRVYEIEKPSTAMKQLAEILVEQTKELKSAVIAINHAKTYGKVAEHCNKIKNSEIKADEIYINSIAELFKKSTPIEIMKQKEILECLESATDKVDHAAQYISDIVMKHG